MSGWTLAIDFGTCFTCAAITGDGRAEVLEVDGGRYLPSVVYRDEHGALLTGRLATSQAAVSPANVARTPKRTLAQGAPLLLGGAPVASEDLVAAVLSTMAAEAIRRAGGQPPNEVVLTHPAAWDAQQIAALGEAAKRAELTPVRFVPEPVAAAAFYTQTGGLPVGAHVAVYDLGGGTFDIAVLRRTRAGFDVIAQGGSDRIGGEDFDEALYELIADHAMTLDPTAWQDFTQATGPRAVRDRALLRREITEAKELLSDTTTRQVIVGDLPVSVTRTEFEAAITEDLRTTITTFQEVLTNAGLTPHDLTAVYLTGGSSRIPLVSDLLSQLLGRTPDLAADPKAVVTLGALQTKPEAARPGEPRIPIPPPRPNPEREWTRPIDARRTDAPKPSRRPLALGPLRQSVSVVPEPSSTLMIMSLSEKSPNHSPQNQQERLRLDAEILFETYCDQMALFCLGSAHGTDLFTSQRDALIKQHADWLPLLDRCRLAKSAAEYAALTGDISAFVRQNYRVLPHVPVIEPIAPLLIGLRIKWKVEERWGLYYTYLQELAAFFDPPVKVNQLGEAVPELHGPIEHASSLRTHTLKEVNEGSLPLRAKLAHLNALLDGLRNALRVIDERVRRAVAEGRL